MAWVMVRGRVSRFGPAFWHGSAATEVPPVDRSRWLRGQVALVGLVLTVLLFPFDGRHVAEA